MSNFSIEQANFQHNLTDFVRRQIAKIIQYQMILFPKLIQTIVKYHINFIKVEYEIFLTKLEHIDYFDFYKESSIYRNKLIESILDHNHHYKKLSFPENNRYQFLLIFPMKSYSSDSNNTIKSFINNKLFSSFKLKQVEIFIKDDKPIKTNVFYLTKIEYVKS